MQIKALEAEIGTQLLERSQRKVELTMAGAVFLRDAREILARVEQATAAAQRAGRGEVGELTIGFVSIADYNVLPLVLSEFRVRCPGVRLNLREATTDALLLDLEQRIDVGFVLSPIQDQNLTQCRCCARRWWRTPGAPSLARARGSFRSRDWPIPLHLFRAMPGTL
jgi:DNA-binding transcriptional LysR family regulator